MKYLKKMCLISLLVFICNTAQATLTENDYLQVAKNFLTYRNSHKRIISVTHIHDKQQCIGRIFHLSGGYLVVPFSKILPPIKAYSLKNDYKTLPQAYKNLIINELKVYQNNTNRNSVNTLSINNQRWEFLLRDTTNVQSKRNYTPDTFLLQTTWNQDYPYNKLLPVIDGNNVLAGCTQAAQAQIMRYHQHPERGKGIASHTWNNQTFETILFREYHWENMSDNIDASTPEYIQDEVALLYRDLAIVNQAEFGLNSTLASLDVDALYEYFGYATDIKEMTNEDENAFFSVIRNEIDNQRPVLLSLPEHATVADGYASDQTGKKIHINMGWGGHDDDYYFLNETIITDTYDFPVTSLRIKYNIMPCNPDENNCYENLSALESNDEIEGLQITGTFDSENDIDAYALYLKGSTEITGDRGYSNQGFYIEVYNSEDTLILSSDETIHSEFPVDFYTIKISLKGYPFNDSYNTYDVQISSQSVTDDEKNLIQNQDNLPIINTELEDRIISAGTNTLIRIDAVDKDGDIVSLNAIPSTDLVEISISDDVLTISSTEGIGHVRIFVIAKANNKKVFKYFDALVSDIELGWGKEFTIQGIFESQSDYNTHPLLLDNQCKITGYNGFSNQAFYTSVLDQNLDNITDMNNDSINQAFNKARYWIGASLEQNPEGGGYYYNYDPDNPGYTLFVTCPDARWTFQDIAEVLGIEIKNTSILTLRQAIQYLQILSGYPVTDLSDIMLIQNISKIGMKDVLIILKQLSEI
jgi:hypothetical protein